MASNPKKHKLSQDTVEEDDELAPSETTHLEGGAQKNSDGEVFFELSPRRRITIRKWRASTLVDIREYWGEKEDLKPGKKGISLSVEQWRQLIELVWHFDTLFKDLYEDGPKGALVNFLGIIMKATQGDGMETARPQLPPPAELQLRREQLEKELEILGDSFTQLKQAQDRFVQNISTLTLLKSASDEHEMLIPLTSSVYVKGVLQGKEKVMVDIGTGYFIEKDITGADEYYVRKIKYLQEQLNMLGKVISEKRQNFSLISQALQASFSGSRATA